MFQRDPITFNRLKALSMRKRMDVVRSPDIGPGLFTALTPSDLASLFPDYYKRILPDVSGFRRAVSAQSAKESAAAAGKLEERLSAVEGKTASIMVPWAQRQKQASAAAPAQLSPEQMAAFQKVQQGAIGLNSPDAKFFSGLSTSQLASIGITKSKDNTGAEVYQYNAPEVTREEAVARLRTPSAGGLKGIIDKAAAKNGIDPKIMYGIVAGESGHGNKYDTNFNKREESWGPFQMNRASWNPGLGSDFERETGLSVKDPSSLQSQADWIAKKIAAKGGNARNWVSSQWYGYKGDKGWDSNWGTMGAGTGEPGPAVKPEGPNGQYSDEQVTATQSRLKKEKEEARLGQFAALVTNNMPDSAGINPTPGGDTVTGGATSKVSAVQYMMNIVGKSEHDPEQRELIRKFLETGGHGVDPAQTAWCAATVGSALRQAGIKDIPADQGGNVATSYGNWGRGVNVTQEGVRAGDVGVFMNHRSTGDRLAPGQVGGHIGMLTGNSRVRSDGKIEVEMIEGNQGDKGSIRWNVIGHRGLEIRRARPGVEYEEQTLTQVAEQAKVEVKPEQQRAGEPPEAPPVAPPEPTADVAKKTELNPQAVKDIQTAPAPSSNKFIFNKQDYLNEIARAHPMIDSPMASMIGQDRAYAWKETVRGLREAESAGVLSYNEKTGEMNIKDMNHPRVQQILKDMKDNQLNQDAFLRKQEAPKPKQQVEAPKETPAPTAPMPTAEVKKPEPAKAGEPPEAPPAPPPEPAPKQVQGYSDGGSFDMKGDTLNLYKVDKQDDMVAINPQTQEPVATLKSGEGITSGDSRVDVTPQSKAADARPEPNPLNTMVQKVNSLENTMQTAIELANRPTSKIESMSADTPTNHASLIADTNRMIANQQKFSPSYDRAMNRIANMTEPAGYNQHYSYGNK